jgi:hypothetical protein
VAARACLSQPSRARVTHQFGGGRYDSSNVPVLLNRLMFDKYQTYQMHIRFVNEETLFYVYLIL